MAKQMSKVYSYTRFSTPEQSEGDSERRQLEAADTWIKKQSLLLDTDLRQVDRGLSGFHSDHKTKRAEARNGTAIFTALRPAWLDLVDNPGEQAKLCEALQERLDGIEAELKSIELKQENLIDQIASTKSAKMRDRYEAQVGKLDDQAAKRQSSLMETQQRLSEAEHSQQSFSKWQLDLETMIKKIKGKPELRQRLNNHLKQFIERIEVYPIGDPQSEDHSGYIAAVADEVDLPKSEWKQLCRFIDEVEKRARTKEGRFVRLVFKTKVTAKGKVQGKSLVGENHKVDLVPNGSLAFGMQLIQTDKRCKAGWRFVSPDISELWDEFQMC